MLRRPAVLPLFNEALGELVPLPVPEPEPEPGAGGTGGTLDEPPGETGANSGSAGAPELGRVSAGVPSGKPGSAVGRVGAGGVYELEGVEVMGASGKPELEAPDSITEWSTDDEVDEPGDTVDELPQLPEGQGVVEAGVDGLT